MSVKNAGIILEKLRKHNKGISMLGEFAELEYTPWRVLIGTILSARCTDEVTLPVSNTLFARYPTAKALASANPRDVEKIIRPIGFYKNKTRFIIESSKMVVKNKNKVPKDMESLMEYPGVGHKVASCVLVYAFDIPEIPVDTHVAVIAERLGWTDEKDPKKIWLDLKNKIPKKHWQMINELFVMHGKNICFKRNPKCYLCPVTKYCKYYLDTVRTKG